MKKIFDYIITFLLRFLSIISRNLNKENRTKFGELIGNSLRLLSKKRYNITFQNISNNLDIDETTAIDITKRSYQNLGITLAELLTLEKIKDSDIRNYITYRNLDLITEAHNEGNGVILLSGHFGNWEYLAYTAGEFTKLPVTVIVKPQSNKIADKYLNKARTSGNNKIVSMHKAARTIVKELSNGNIIALLADQSTTGKTDVMVDFFGRQTPTYAAPASLSLKFNSPIIIGFAIRDKEGIYNVNLERIDPQKFKNEKDPVKALTQEHVKYLEKAIRSNPHLWSWQHRRWKHSPDEIQY
jgi:KDO2-lipid IV(A) lauroyltransferase